ncbi:hypothetical protein [Vibrio coralliirubri]|uniref:hypothetical protein n=1 Tax=Vibrio coralliirubri TaxID=1516159 RepID=UPI000EFB969C|nr:hypothetical protein [Vibrio coralliirubri]
MKYIYWDDSDWGNLWFKVVSFMLLTSILGYLVVESWFVTALINSSTINLDHRGANYSRIGESITAAGIAINLLYFGFKFLRKACAMGRIDHDEAHRIASSIAVVCALLFAFISVYRYFFYSGSSFWSITSILFFCTVATRLPIVRLFVTPFLLLFMVFYLSFISLNTFLNYYLDSTKAQTVFCSVAGEAANQMSLKNGLKLNNSWVTGDDFQTIEHYQLERRYISIAACVNPDFLSSIVKKPEYKNMLREEIIDSMAYQNPNLLQSVRSLKYNLPDLYDDYSKLSKVTGKRRLKYAYNKVINKLHAKGVKDPVKFAKSIGISRTAPARVVSKNTLYRKLTHNIFGEALDLTAPPLTLIERIVDKSFEERYEKIKNDLTSVDIEHFKPNLLPKYHDIGRINLVLVLSVLTIMCSFASLLSSMVGLIPLVSSNGLLRILLGPPTFLACLWALSFNLLNTTTSDYYRSTLFPEANPYSVSAHALQLHIATYPELKKFFDNTGYSAWLDTYHQYNKDNYIRDIKQQLDLAMKTKRYSTPIQNSALVQIERLRYLAREEEKARNSLETIGAYYKHKNDSHRLAYVDSKLSHFSK